MKVLSKSSEYGLRALAYLVSRPEKSKYVGIGEIADSLGLSFYFLTKIFRDLTENGILISYRGPNGGVALKKPANEVMIIDIVHILEGEDYFDKCLLGLPGCGELAPCPLHHFWSNFKGEMKKEFQHTSLAELGDKVRVERLRIGE